MLVPKPGIKATRDPEKQCKGLANGNPCYYERVDGSDYCAMHGGQAAVRAKRKKDMYDFRKSQYFKNLANKHMQEFSKGKNKFDLSEELGITRIILQEILEKCTDDMELLRYNQKISTTVAQIEKLIISSLKLDQKLGALVSKDEMIEIAQALIESIQKYIKDPLVTKAIVEDFEKVLNDRFVQNSPS